MASRKYKQGRFIPKNPEKYIGNVNDITFRSSWEKRLMEWCDANPSILYYNSEEVIIPYYDPGDLKMHKYHVDFLIKVKSKSGELKTYLVEVKPDAQTKKPRKSRNLESYTAAVLTYVKNQAKWEAATSWCKERGISFLVLTEYDIGIKKRK